MKKNIKLILILIISIFLTTGCTLRQNYGLAIDKNGNVTSELTMAMDNEMIDNYLTYEESGADTTDENFKAVEHTDEQRWAFMVEK